MATLLMRWNKNPITLSNPLRRPNAKGLSVPVSNFAASFEKGFIRMNLRAFGIGEIEQSLPVPFLKCQKRPL
jgi:hypothetical protein